MFFLWKSSVAIQCHCTPPWWSLIVCCCLLSGSLCPTPHNSLPCEYLQWWAADLLFCATPGKHYCLAIRWGLLCYIKFFCSLSFLSCLWGANYCPLPNRRLSRCCAWAYLFEQCPSLASAICTTAVLACLLRLFQDNQCVECWHSLLLHVAKGSWGDKDHLKQWCQSHVLTFCLWLIIPFLGAH